MTNQMLAFRTLFRRATKVVCHKCSKDLTGTDNLARLARLGCPGCKAKQFDYTFDEVDAQAVKSIIGG